MKAPAAAWPKAERQDRPTHREAAMALGNILERIATSRGLEVSS